MNPRNQQKKLKGCDNEIPDPLFAFGKAEYLGSTTPIVGASIKDLSISDNGTCLSGNLMDWDSTVLSSGVLTWNLPQLIKAANAHSLAKQATNRPIPFDRTNGTQIPEVTPVKLEFGPVVGMIGEVALLAPKPTVSNGIHFGDILRIDIQQAIRDQYPQLADKFNFNNYNRVKVESSNAEILKYGDKPISGAHDPNLPFASAASAANYSGDFNSQGVFFISPTLSKGDLELLRKGEHLKDREVLISIEGLSGLIKILITDYTKDPKSVFFGDRPLDDLGYTKFELSGTVGSSSVKGAKFDNAPLDVWRVEQRLKYLGFSAFGSALPSDPSNPKNPVEFTVNGTLDPGELSALRAFYAETHYLYNNGGINKVANEKAIVALNSENLKWLNAYNAPHWVNAYAVLGIPQKPGGQNADFQDGTESVMEVYATSWTADLLKAAQLNRSAQVINTGNPETLNQQNPNGTQKQIRLNGLTAPTRLAGQQHATGAHSIGMGIDYGFSYLYIERDPFQIKPIWDQNPPPITGSGWSLKNAYDWANLLSPGPVTKNNQAGALRSFLSFYALTIDDSIPGNGTWEDLPIKNDATGSQTVRKALFGSGVQNDKQMLQNLWLGAPGMNTYKGMHEVLDKLGITAANSVPHNKLALHQNHFHVDIRPPQWVGLPDNLGLPKKLIATQDAVPQLQDVPVPTLMLSNEAVAELRQDFGFTEEMTMFVPDMPNVPDQYLPVLVAEARPAASTSTSKEMTFGFCGLVPNISGQVVGREHELNPASIAVADLWDFDEYFKQMPEDQRREALMALEKTAKVTILQQPKYGTLTDTAKPAYQDTITGLFYNPKSGYMGKDQVVFLVEMGEYKIKLIFNIYPVDGSPENPEAIKKMCGKRGQYYKIASASEQLTSWFNTASLGGLTDSGVTVNSADLAGAAIGQTTGSNITLDTTAAGNGWFVDSTPSDNSEYLPTSNSNEWIAKAGTAAAGKMDMLSVLLHEYGHALGIDHSANPNDFMSTTLTAGVRRLPSAAEMALMQQLIAQAKTSVIAPQTGSNAATDQPNNTPLPIIPLGGFGIAFAGLLQRNRYGGVNLAIDANTVVTQYAIAANATLTNGINAADGWNTLARRLG